MLAICAADKALGEAIGEAIHAECLRLPEPASLFYETTASHFILDKFLLKELSLVRVPKLGHMGTLIALEICSVARGNVC